MLKRLLIKTLKILMGKSLFLKFKAFYSNFLLKFDLKKKKLKYKFLLRFNYLLIYFNKYLRLPLTIKWFGRLGNNIYQICIAILYSKKNKFDLFIPKHQYIKSFNLCNFNNFKANFKIINRFFFHENQIPFFNDPVKNNRDIELDEDYIVNEIQNVAIKFVIPNINVIEKYYDDETLVIHLRGGDVFLDNLNYPQNPFCFFEKVMKLYKKILIVYEKTFITPLLSKLKNYENVSIQSLSTLEDFSTLLNAKNLALSGFGTFALSAALCSKVLKNLYCTDLFSRNHMNPTMIKTAKVHCLEIASEYKKLWSGNFSDKKSLMLNFETNKKFIRLN